MQYFIIFLEILTAINIASKGSFVRNFLSIFYIMIISLQICSLITTGSFVPAVAVGNIAEYQEIGIKPYLVFTSIAIVIIFIMAITQKFRTKKLISNICIVLAFILPLVFSTKTTTKSLFNTLKDAYKENIANKLDPQIREELEKTLLKDKIVYDSNVSNYIKRDKYNVIVLFIEGFSRRIISKELTPNIYNFAKEGINVINYYNHTASTYRGLRGQLTSSFQISTGYTSRQSGLMQLNEKEFKRRYKNDALISIAQILSENNYTTAFQMPNPKKSNFFKVFNLLGFKNLFGYEDFKNPISWQVKELSDEDSFKLVFEKIHTLKQPFFYGFYTLGTHFGLNMPENGKKYKDGKNAYLNNYHNLDYQFGEFMKKFNNDEISKNTIFILTADHASFASKEFRELFNSQNKSFIDKIPLVIYLKGNKPAIFDAKNLNSLSLTPSILDILGIEDGQNRFLGLSIFDENPHPIENYISAVGSKKYKVINGEVEKISDDDKYKKEVDKISLYQKFGG